MHIALVRRFDLNPWKLAGWGMYSAPQLPARARIFCLTPDEAGICELRVFDPELQRALDEFLWRRSALRRLVRPDDVARIVLANSPAIDGVRIDVLQPTLLATTGMIEERATTYEYKP